MKGIRCLKITWLDSLQDGHSIWQFPEDVKKNYKKSKEHFISIGFLIYQDKKNTVIANSVHFDDMGKEVIKVGDIFSIPTGAILHKKYLNESTKNTYR